MRARTKAREGCVQFSDSAGPGGSEGSSNQFLRACRESAASRCEAAGERQVAVHTVEYVVPTKFGDLGSTGSIVLHVSEPLLREWERDLEGTPAQRRLHIESQLRLAMEDLGMQDMHGYLALTPGQRACYLADLEQLVTEALGRTNCSHFHRQAVPHWEGTLVKSVRPPLLVLVVSIT